MPVNIDFLPERVRRRNCADRAPTRRRIPSIDESGGVRKRRGDFHWLDQHVAVHLDDQSRVFELHHTALL